MGINVSIHKSVCLYVSPSVPQLHATPESGQPLESRISIASQIRVPAARVDVVVFQLVICRKFIQILLARLGSAAPCMCPGSGRLGLPRYFESLFC